MDIDKKLILSHSFYKALKEGGCFNYNHYIVAGKLLKLP